MDLKKHHDTLKGTIIGNQKGFAFFKQDDSGISSDRAGQNNDNVPEDIFISPEDLSDAMHGDRVRIKIIEKADPENGKRARGRVVEVISRNSDPIIGTFIVEGRHSFVRPDKKQYSRDIEIKKADRGRALNADKVVVKIKNSKSGDIFGKVTEIIGHAGDQGLDISSVARQFDMPYNFSDECLQEAAEFGDEVLPGDLSGRADLSKLLTVTIDGADAKDFDDAISLEKDGDNYRLYVHIADVSHYVKEGSAMDKEAYARGNSVYLLDRVIPMLPEALSNGLCSLNPGKLRLTMTTEILLTAEGRVIDHKFYESFIVSDYRLVYKDVSDFIEEGKGFEDKEDVRELLCRMKNVYEGLAKASADRGSLDFDLPETELVLDASGVPKDVFKQERRVANRIIEEFMILNNVLVAEYFYYKKLPFIYRIHERPTPDGLERLNRCLFAISYPMISEKELSPKVLRNLLNKAEGRDEQVLLHNTVLRSMTKAIYSSQTEIHFGLALDHYSHFTAPIRRYSDIIAHRFLKDMLKGKGQNKKSIKHLSEACRHVSECEETAQEAERDVVAMKSAEYMQAFVGQEFEGKISSLTNFGIFVMLDNTIEGLIHFRTLNDDYYRFDEDRMLVVGERSNRQFHYGQKVRIKVLAANPLLREIDFGLVDMEPFISRAGRYRKGRKNNRKTDRTGKSRVSARSRKKSGKSRRRKRR